jgi:hypothetical protein
MRQIFYLLSLLSLLVLVYVVDHYVGQVYARYVIVYTGAVFMLGMVVGQRSERSWVNRQKESKGLSVERP